ncbi:MAG: PTS sugar transporter subunit IIB [Anaerococcus sp.]|nr:PTS sugar transporter subunit IIB [Anaerococcus sp.]
MSEIKLARIDSRLSHGKMVESFSKKLDIDTVIIANDDLYQDEFRKDLMDLTIPDDIRAFYLKIDMVRDFLASHKEDVFLIVENAKDLEDLRNQGIRIKEINIGIIHMSIGKKALTEEVAVDSDDLRIFKEFMDEGCNLYVRLSPYSQRMELHSLLN